MRTKEIDEEIQDLNLRKLLEEEKQCLTVQKDRIGCVVEFEKAIQNSILCETGQMQSKSLDMEAIERTVYYMAEHVHKQFIPQVVNCLETLLKSNSMVQHILERLGELRGANVETWKRDMVADYQKEIDDYAKVTVLREEEYNAFLRDTNIIEKQVKEFTGGYFGEDKQKFEADMMKQINAVRDIILALRVECTLWKRLSSFIHYLSNYEIQFLSMDLVEGINEVVEYCNFEEVVATWEQVTESAWKLLQYINNNKISEFELLDSKEKYDKEKVKELERPKFDELPEQIYYDPIPELTPEEQEIQDKAQRWMCNAKDSCMTKNCALLDAGYCENGFPNLISCEGKAKKNEKNCALEGSELCVSGRIAGYEWEEPWKCNFYNTPSCSMAECALYNSSDCKDGYLKPGMCTVKDTDKCKRKLCAPNLFGACNNGEHIKVKKQEKEKCQFAPSTKCAWGECVLFGTRQCVNGFPQRGECELWKKGQCGKESCRLYGIICENGIIPKALEKAKRADNRLCEKIETVRKCEISEKGCMVNGKMCKLHGTKECIIAHPKLGKCGFRKSCNDETNCALKSTSFCQHGKRFGNSTWQLKQCTKIAKTDCITVNCALWKTNQCKEGYVKRGRCEEYGSSLCRKKKCAVRSNRCVEGYILGEKRKCEGCFAKGTMADCILSYDMSEYYKKHNLDRKGLGCENGYPKQGKCAFYNYETKEGSFKLCHYCYLDGTGLCENGIIF